jgi:hypothetical protein
MYRALGFAHATAYHHAHRARRSLAAEDGQGTIEYIGLILLIAGVMAVVVTHKNDADLGPKIVSKLKEQIDAVGSGGK